MLRVEVVWSCHNEAAPIPDAMAVAAFDTESVWCARDTRYPAQLGVSGNESMRGADVTSVSGNDP